MTVPARAHGLIRDAAGTELFRLDLTDGALFAGADLGPVWRALRESAPVAWQQLADGRGFWVVTRYRECREVLNDHDRFTSAHGNMLGTLGRRDPAGGRQMITSDPPHLTALREPLQQLLNMAALRRRAPLIRADVRRAVERACRGGAWDVGAAMSALPARVGALVMGLDPDAEAGAALVRCSAMSVAPDDPEYAAPGGREDTLRQAHGGLFRYFAEEIDRRHGRADRGDDVVDRLLATRVGGRRLSAAEVAVNCYNLMIGATATTGFAVTRTIAHLAADPALYDRWSTDPALLRSGVEEAVRWSSPAMHSMRHARRDTELGGVRIAGGDPVVAWLTSANRDEDAFRDPDAFDPARVPNQHLAFGSGAHLCLGAATARVTMRIAFEEIFRLVGRFEQAGEAVRLHSSFIDGIKHLPVVAHPRR